MTVMRRLEQFTHRGHRVTLVSPEPYHYYSGMGPGLLGGLYRRPQARFHVARMVEDRNGQFCQATVARIDAEGKRLVMTDGSHLDFDLVSFNVGSEVIMPAGVQPDETLIPVKPVVNLARAHERLLARSGNNPVRLIVIGGGPAGVEVAGNAARFIQQSGRTGEVILLAGTKLLAAFPDQVATLVKSNFATRNIVIREGARVVSAAQGCVALENGEQFDGDLVFLATGVKPPALFRDSDLPVGPDGGLLVNRFLQVDQQPALFGGGDCIDFAHKPLARVGVYAVRQNPILFDNLQTALEEKVLTPFIPQPHVMLIFNLGDGNAVLHRRGRVLNGTWAFRFKDWIDRRFMRRFQVSGERSASKE